MAGTTHTRDVPALDHQSHSSPVIKGVWFQRWNKNKWKYGTVPFIKGDAWKAVVRWYRPVEPLQRSLGPLVDAYHLFPCDIPAKRIGFVMTWNYSKFDLQRKGLIFWQGSSAPATCHCACISATNRFIRSWPGYNRSWHFSHLQILLGSTPAPPLKIALFFPWNERVRVLTYVPRTYCCEFHENGNLVLARNKGIA